MNNSLTTYRRRGAVALIAGALLTISGALFSAIVQASGSVPDSLVRYPFSHNVAVPFVVFSAACHVVILVGVVYLARGGFAGTSKTGRIGLGCVIAGLALLFVCEWAQLPFLDQDTSNMGPTIVYSGFGLATMLLAGGMIAAGVAALRQPGFPSWRQNAPLICGLLSLVVIPIQFTHQLWLGVIVFSVGYIVLGLAVIGGDARRAEHAIQIA